LYKYLRRNDALKNENSIQEEIKSRLKSENACYLSVQIFVFQAAVQKFKH